MNQECQIRQNGRSQFSLIDLFAWVTLFSLIAASVTSMPILSAAAIGGHGISTADAFPSGLTWLVLLGLHIRRRSSLAIAVHTVPVLVISITLVALQIDWNSAAGFLLITMICSSCVSLLFVLGSLPIGTLRKYANSFVRFAYHMIWVTALITVICAIFPSLAYGRIHYPAVIFGATIGAWAGLYQAIVATESMREFRIASISIRYVTLAGLAGAFVLPITNEIVGKLNGLYPVQPEFGPIAGLVTAAIAFFGLWIASLASARKLN